ncbi:MAG: leucyl aminopeptidase [Miltoncostaeaceae bacterium]|jgi:leucyl aminopeptidase|nr:leucyl aminopeptidase [Miltoncostaeaceae bacterium]
MKTKLRSTDPLAARCDLLVVAVADPAAPLVPPADALDAALGGALARSVADGEVKGAPGTLAVFHAAAGAGAPRAAVVGVGGGSAEDWREAGAAAGKRARALKAADVALAAPAGADGAAVGAFVEGFGAGQYRFDRFKTDEDGGAPVATLTVHGSTAKVADLTRAARLVRAQDGARDLGNTPSNHLTPTRLADHARALAEATPGLECEVLQPKQLAKLGAGALLAVAQGSEEPPAMIVLRYTPRRRAAKGEVLGLVGKAVTFDTGGISIKPSGGMEEMKLDMAGGAAVIEGAALIADLKLPVEVLAVVPTTENMPSGRAIKPGDVITTMSGKTVEVINTDAEGRLILADGLAYAARQGATRLVDFATLTGAIVVALGEVYAGLFGSDDDWTAAVREAGETSGDLAWPMPLHKGYAELIESKVADLSNAAAKRQAGAVYAAQFLREFTAGLPWCHVDIAGTGMVGGRGTGFGVGMILAIAEGLAGR